MSYGFPAVVFQLFLPISCVHTSNFTASMFRHVSSIFSNKLVTEITYLKKCFKVHVCVHVLWLFVICHHRALDNQVYAAGVSVARDESASYVSWANSTLVSPWWGVWCWLVCVCVCVCVCVHACVHACVFVGSAVIKKSPVWCLKMLPIACCLLFILFMTPKMRQCLLSHWLFPINVVCFWCQSLTPQD